MQLKRLDHVNVRTANLQAMVAWYEDVLGMKAGPRPDFPFGGAWLYCDGFPIVHLVEVQRGQQAIEPRLEHFAISGEGMADFLAHLRSRKVAYQCSVTTSFGIQHVNVWDPDANHIHVDFAPGEQADRTDYDGS